jgi:cytochrome oxidase Cu insertion factor (SCO1/SenC/PrrC family)
VRRVYVLSVAAAAIVGVAAGVLLHNTLSGGSAGAQRPALSALHGQATWPAGRAPAPAFALHDQHGRRVSLSSFRGHQVVLAFMDSYCTAECPLEARQLAAALRPLPARVRPQLLVVSVNLADTPHSIAAAARKWRLPAGFEWFVGTHRALARVWRAYGIVVRPTSGGDIAHSDAFYVIDRHGDERAGFLPPFVPGLLTADLRVLARE